MIDVKLTPTQFAAKCAQLKAEQGIEITGNAGQIVHDGFAAGYLYDGSSLIITVSKHPFFIPVAVIDSHLLAWFAGS